MNLSITKYLKKRSNGSAIAEFLIFTLPFFTIFLILMTQIHSKSMALLESNNLARQAVRAFVTSPTAEVAMIRAYQVIDLYKSNLAQEAQKSRPINLNISCQEFPCFSPGNKVSATVSIGRLSTSTASEYIDLWR
jgi:aspartate carbamoyltransferase regulatory subunit